ncbi:hypothetical protein BDV11DRAFT_197618 [Aspergillus similis]
MTEGAVETMVSVLVVLGCVSRGVHAQGSGLQIPIYYIRLIGIWMARYDVLFEIDIYCVFKQIGPYIGQFRYNCDKLGNPLCNLSRACRSPATTR